MIGKSAVWAGLILLFAAGCQKAPPEGEEAGSAVRGARAFAENCVVCHGAGARGDGPLAADLPVPPADLTALSAANGGAFPMAQVLSQIHGYPGRYQSGAMPEFGPLLAGRQTSWSAPDGQIIATPTALLDLATYLRQLQR